MSDKREFTAYVTLRSPEDHQAVTFEPGDVVPDWASVGEHVTQGVTRSVKTAEAAPENVDTGDTDEVTTELVTPEYEADEADDEDESLPPYEEWSKTDLRAEVDGRELDVPKKATIAELAEALTADDLIVAAEEAK